MKKIYLLRHASSEGSGYIGSRSDVHLTPAGHTRARQLGMQLSSLSFDLIYASPLLRCRETLFPYLAQNPKSKVIFDKALQELDFGLFEGMTYTGIQQRYPKEQTVWQNDPIHIGPPEGESLAALHIRIHDFIRSSIEEVLAENILICAHGGSIRAMICELLHLGPEHHWDFQVDRGNFVLIQIFQHDCSIMSSMNTPSLI